MMRRLWRWLNPEHVSSSEAWRRLNRKYRPRLCGCGEIVTTTIPLGLCQDCWERHCDEAWWKAISDGTIV